MQDRCRRTALLVLSLLPFEPAQVTRQPWLSCAAYRCADEPPRHPASPSTRLPPRRGEGL
eukprot:16136-Eustigmatos_ZCMA.PRE.1